MRDGRPHGCECTAIAPRQTEDGRCVECERVREWLAARPPEPRNRYLKPKQLAKLMGQAITGRWDVPPDEARGIVRDLIDVFKKTGFNQDRIAIAGHLLKIPALQLKESELEMRQKSGDDTRPRIIVVREIDGGLAEAPPEPTEGEGGGESV
jgi:hypothetical protein